METDFDKIKAENFLWDLSYKLCDKCTVDPVLCGSSYGNRNSCDILARKLDNMLANGM